ncbi:MAG: PHP domain-containing protein [Eubacterium sp.]|nr:PHP domain-containing protein [Eubacterium sp.]
MNKYYYDLHIHSCLSPCADNDNTPNNLAGMASLCKLDIIALTDHNSAKNCPAFFEACGRYGITPVAGMELTTAEDIHAICLFEELEGALEFDTALQSRRMLIPNRTDIFGEQLILDGGDNVIESEEYFLSNATDISLDEAPKLVEKYSGICYPAHIDRQANGVISVLGTFPETPEFRCIEFNLAENAEEYIKKYKLTGKKIIVSSDAHYLTELKDRENYFELDSTADSDVEIRKSLFKYLKE